MSAIDDLPPLGDVIRRYDLTPKKSLGQNFLLDLNLTARIAKASGPLEGVTVVEVGPGPGGLTRALLALGARKVIAIERDERAIAALAEVSERYPGRLEVVAGDALEFDPRPMLGLSSVGRISNSEPVTTSPGNAPDGPVRIVANLPYNIATALLVGWLTTDPWPPWYESLTLMFQREVAERIVAKTDAEAYGRLSVLAGWRTQARILFDIAPSAFVPPPKVVSSVVHLVPLATPAPCDLAALEKVTAAAFGQRRKMLRQSLKSLGVDPTVPLLTAGIDPTARAETISVESFAALARAFVAQGHIKV
jgi:16S rRNA (adenine1518-N6/adenine1519-N6)-dimethyltransferase